MARLAKLNQRMKFIVAASGGDPNTVTPAQYDAEYLDKEGAISAKYPDRDFSILLGDQAKTATSKSGEVKEDRKDDLGNHGASGSTLK